MRVSRRIANLGYGSQREIKALIRAGRVTDADGTALSADADVPHESIRIDGDPLDSPPGLTLMLHKPAGYTVSTTDPGRTVYALLPPRFLHRKPLVAPVGRLDRDTTGLLLMTDDGQLLHRLTRPRGHVPKLYEVTLDRPMRGDEAAVFASGTLMLKSETTPLAPATLDVLDATHCRLTLTEGRYHQIRRMFAAVGNHVTALHRARIGGLSLGDLAPGAWRYLTAEELATAEQR